MMLFIQEQDSLELMRVKLAVANIATYLTLTEPDQHRPEVDAALKRLWARRDALNQRDATYEYQLTCSQAWDQTWTRALKNGWL